MSWCVRNQSDKSSPLRMVQMFVASLVLGTCILTTMTNGQEVLSQALAVDDLQLDAMTSRLVRLTDQLDNLLKEKEEAMFTIGRLEEAMDRLQGLPSSQILQSPIFYWCMSKMDPHVYIWLCSWSLCRQDWGLQAGILSMQFRTRRHRPVCA